MDAAHGGWTPRVPLVAAERRVDFPGINSHIRDRRIAVEKVAIPAANRLAYIVAQHSLPSNQAEGKLAETLYTALTRTIDYGYKSVRRELSAPQRSLSAAVRHPGIGDQGRVVLGGLPAVHGLVRSRAKLVATNVAGSARSAAHKAALEPGSTPLMVGQRTSVAALRTLHNGVLQVVGEALNLGRAAAAQDILLERGGGKVAGMTVTASGGAVPEFCMRSEQLDENTCAECDLIHGEIYQVGSDDYYNDMPPAYCEGDGRCRGLYIYGEGSEFGADAPMPRDGGPAVRPLSDIVPRDQSTDWISFRDGGAAEMQYRSESWAKDAKSTPEELQAAVGDRLRELVSEANVRIRVTPDSLKAILDDGRFKSQFETGSSGGMFDPATRAQAEAHLFGYAEDLPAELRPIYGYLSGDEENHWLGMYGDIRVELRSEVKARSTFTAEDSLGMRVLPVPMEGGDDFALAYDWMVQPGVRTPAEVKIDTAAIRSEATMKDLSGAYPEAQIHGGLAVSDIRGVEIPDWKAPSYWGRELERADQLEKLLLEHGEGDISTGLAEVARLRALASSYLTDPYTEVMARLDELGITWRRVPS